MSYPSMTSARSPSVSRVLLSAGLTMALIGLSACSSTPPKLQPPTETKQPPLPVLPAPEPVKLETVRWQVVEVDGEALFALPARGYEALSRNMSEMVRWAREASYQLDFYRRTRQQPVPEGDGKGGK